MLLSGIALGAGTGVAIYQHFWLAALMMLLPLPVAMMVWHRVSPSIKRFLGNSMLALAIAVASFGATQLYASNLHRGLTVFDATAEPGSLVDWIWSGGTTDSSTVVKAALTGGTDASNVRLLITPRDGSSEPRYIDPSIASGVYGDVVTFNVGDLTENSVYTYAITTGDTIDTARSGQFHTFPTGAASFTFAFGSCAETGSNAAVFDAIREQNPLFFLSPGDFFYEDIAKNDPGLYRAAFDETLASPRQSHLYRSTSLAYVWDDHDYGPNNSDGTSPGREAAQANYDAVVPHYELSSGDNAGPIYQAFTVGRVRFIMTDNYSFRSPDSSADGAGKTMLGAEQKEWLKQQLIEANETHALVVWVNSQPWIAEPGPDTDGWGAFPTERKELANFIAENEIDQIVMLSGDAHMLAMDDGSNSNYATEGDGSFPIFHAAALDRNGSRKGGPYSEGSYPGRGQFGMMAVNDTGGHSIEIVWSGRNQENNEVVGLTFTVENTLGGAATPAASPILSTATPVASPMATPLGSTATPIASPVSSPATPHHATPIISTTTPAVPHMATPAASPAATPDGFPTTTLPASPEATPLATATRSTGATPPASTLDGPTEVTAVPTEEIIPTAIPTVATTVTIAPTVTVMITPTPPPLATPLP